MTGDSNTPIPIVGAIKHYLWGDEKFIPRLLHQSPDGRPWAELWLGTHPNGPAHLPDGKQLSDLSGDLPYLLKVLAAARPLSLQAHPNAKQARDGFARGLYPDPHAKPELLCALTPFEAFCGVRPAKATLALLDEIGATGLASEVAQQGVGAVITGLYRGTVDHHEAITACQASQRPEAAWVRTLSEIYPNDRSISVTLLLNYVKLQPGEAIHLTAGNLHAYLSGAGIELMGASDNVVRGGLTEKDVDVDELLRIVDLTPLDKPTVHTGAQTGRYPLTEAGYVLVRIEPGEPHKSIGNEIAICLDGTTMYLPPDSVYTPAHRAFVVTRLTDSP